MPRKRIHGQNPTAQVRYTRTMGIDTDSRYLVTAFYNADHPEQLQIHEYPQNQSGIRELIAVAKIFAPELIIIESTANYHVMAYDALAHARLPIVVINPITVKALLRVEGKSDKGDAVTLARIGAGFSLSASNMPNDLQRELRLAFSRYDNTLVERSRLQMRLSAQLLGASITLSRIMSSSSKVYAAILQGIADGMEKEDLAGLGRTENARGKILEALPDTIPPYIREHIKHIYPHIASLNNMASNFKAQILTYLDKPEIKPLLVYLTSVPAVSEFLALRIVAEMGENFWQRYPTASAFVKAIGVVPSNELSGGKLLKKGSSHGNVRLKMHLLMSVKAWVMYCKKHPAIDWYLAYRERSNYMKATSAIARQVAEACYHVCRLQQPYKFMGRYALIGNQWVDSTTGEIYAKFNEAVHAGGDHETGGSIPGDDPNAEPQVKDTGQPDLV